MKELLVYKYDSEAKLPTRAHQYDAGADIYALHDAFIPHGKTVEIDTGIAVNILPGYVGKIEDRSGMGRKGLAVASGVIDSEYTGRLTVVLHNITNQSDHTLFGQVGYQVKKGDRIAQLLIYQVALPVSIESKKLWNSERGDKKFSSSGR